jgi:hypothetical protein
MLLLRGVSPGLDCALRVGAARSEWWHGSQIGLRSAKVGCFVYRNRASAVSHAINEWPRYDSVILKWRPFDAHFLFRTMAADAYFVNVRFMFNGDRMVLGQAYRRRREHGRP